MGQRNYGSKIGDHSNGAVRRLRVVHFGNVFGMSRMQTSRTSGMDHYLHFKFPRWRMSQMHVLLDYYARYSQTVCRTRVLWTCDAGNVV